MIITREQYDKLVQIYNSLNAVTGQMSFGEPLTHGQIEVFGHSMIELYRLINDIEGATPEEIVKHVEWNADF